MKVGCGRGNEDTFRDNEIRDEVVNRFNNNIPNQPTGVPLEGLQDPDFLILTAGGFVDVDGDGLDDILISSRRTTEIDPEDRGAVWLFWGEER